MDGSWIGILATLLLAWFGYFLGIPLWAILTAVAIGTVVEFTIIKPRSRDD
jgi:uncharacterized protein (DUF58 family)